MPWTKEENIFCVTTYLETKSFKTVQAKFRRKFNFNNYPQKSPIYVFWGTQAPDEVLQKPLHSVKCTVWVAISKHGMIGPFWFEDADKEAVTVTNERYIVVLNKFWTALGARRGVNRDV